MKSHTHSLSRAASFGSLLRDPCRAECYDRSVSESSIAPGLLVAMPQLMDPNFHRAVVLLIHHDSQGTFGLILNRATEITARTLCETLEIEWRGDPSWAIGWGGPVQPETGWLLFDPGDAPTAGSDEGVQRIEEGLSFAGSLDTLRRVASDPPQKTRVLLGYAGWGPGQLEGELSEGAWITAPISLNVVFDVEARDMWEHVVRGLGIEPATLISTRGIH